MRLTVESVDHASAAVKRPQYARTEVTPGIVHLGIGAFHRAHQAASNRATLALPFGPGFHHWLPRTPATRLQAEAESVWLEDARYLPVKRVPVKSRPDWDFSSFRSLPVGWINNAFTGWNGRATIIWEDRGLTLDLEARPLLSTFIRYSPSANAPCFCFEPVSHAVDAHNLPPGPEEYGLVVLTPGAMLAAERRFRVHEIQSRSRR